jgi:hypothetical protein
MSEVAISTPPRQLPPVLPPPQAAPISVIVAEPLGADDRPRLAAAGLTALAATAVLLHLVVTWVSPYGPHRDELLYMAMGRHLRMWEMDFPPLVALLSELTRGTFGDSLVALRLAPALAAAAIVVLAVLLARVMGGYRPAQLLAGGAVLASPLFLRAGNLFQPVVFDQLWWTVALYALARIAYDARPKQGGRHRAWADGRPHRSPAQSQAAHRWHIPRNAFSVASLLDRPAARWWLLLGAAVGFGLLTKFSIVFLGIGVAVALLATRLRRTLLTPWPWIALLTAAVIGAPSIAGQLSLGWPVLGQMRALRTAQLDRVGPLAFLGGQLVLGPAILLAAYGLWELATRPALRPFRALAWACGAAFAILLALHGKPYYAGPIYPVLFAAGAVGLERATFRLPMRRRRVTRAAAALVLGAFALVTLPLSLPILPPAELARYAADFGALGARAARTTNTGTVLAIPQDFADMLGWPQQVAAVARAAARIPAEAQQDAVVIAGNYGEAGAVEYYGPRLGLPPVVSPAGSFWYFGPSTRAGSTAIAIGIPVETLRRYYARVTPIERVQHEVAEWVVPEERDVVVALCEQPIAPIQTVWESLRPY